MTLHLRSALFDVEHELQPEWLELPLVIRGAHRALLVLAYHLADGGRIAGCKGWSSIRWTATVGFQPRHFFGRLLEHGLIRWQGDDLLVTHYILNHEKRIRGLVEIRVPQMNAARLARGSRGGSSGGEGGSWRRVNAAKTHRSPPSVQNLCTEPLHRALTPDPAPISSSKRQRVRTVRSLPEDRGCVTERRVEGPAAAAQRARLAARAPTERRAEDAHGPEGFERWVRTMPIVREAPTAALARRWREQNLEYWVRYDLEGEADEIVAETERRRKSTAWEAGFIPTPINFLRLAPWRKRPRLKRPTVYAPAATWVAPEEQREFLADYLKTLVKS